jgi:hypothetical protein
MKNYICGVLFVLGLPLAVANAGELNPAQQGMAYEQCMSPCVKEMEKTAFGQTIRDKPFVYQSYCSCYCARTALRLTTEQLAQMGSDAVNKGDMFFTQENKAFARRTAQQCFEPLMSK